MIVQLNDDYTAPTDPHERSSWWPVDLTDVLDGTWAPPKPTIGLRSDGVGLFYPGRDHAIVSESEAGKTWLALVACLDEMQGGRHVAYIDFEGDAGSVVNRLLMMGAKRALVADTFHYIRPTQKLVVADIAETIWTHTPSLVIIDGITEAMALHGLDPLDNKDVAMFGQLLPKALMRLGPAIVSLDHVTKATEGRGRYAIGGVHKLNGLDGAAYALNNRDPFGVGLTGRTTIKIAKDRHGQIRAQGLPSSDGMHWFGDLIVKSEEGFAEVYIDPPHAQPEDFRPTLVMAKLADALGQANQPLSQRVLLDLIGGKTDTKRKAFALLQAEGYVTTKTPHSLIKPFVLDPDS